MADTAEDDGLAGGGTAYDRYSYAYARDHQRAPVSKVLPGQYVQAVPVLDAMQTGTRREHPASVAALDSAGACDGAAARLGGPAECLTAYSLATDERHPVTQADIDAMRCENMRLCRHIDGLEADNALLRVHIARWTERLRKDAAGAAVEAQTSIAEMEAENARERQAGVVAPVAERWPGPPPAIRPGEFVTCEAGHLICEVLAHDPADHTRFGLLRDGIELDLGAWRVEGEAAAAVRGECPCGAPFTRAVQRCGEIGFQIHIKGRGWV